jgi:pilus assembly protein Flp/PilA
MFNHAIAYVMSVLAAPKRDEEKGATAVEYALVIGLVAVVLVGALALLEGRLETFVNTITFS